MRNKPIGIFDSGVGGLTVLKELDKLMPNENYIYFGDTARIPYGEKTKEQLHGYVRGILEWFKANNVKSVIMACNTSSALVYETVKNEYNFPIFSLIDPTAEYISYLNAEKIGVIATTATINSKAYSRGIQALSPTKEIIEVACPGLVEIVENNCVDSYEAQKMVMKYILPLIEKKVEKIILGCTHYPFLIPVIKNIIPDQEMIVDPAKHLAFKANESLMFMNLLNIQKCGFKKYFVSSNPTRFVQAGKRFYSNIFEAEEVPIGEITGVVS